MTLLVPKITRKLLTNEAYGFPRGEERRLKPIAVACLHITGNPSNPPATAAEERTYANRSGSDGPSAHFYVDRDGSAIEAVDTMFAAWSNGDVKSPKLGTPGIPDVLDLLDRNRNVNEAYAVEIETCGRYSAYPITKAQESTISYLIAKAAIAFDLPIYRSTVHLHSDLNTETRSSCPVPPGIADEFRDRIVQQAKDYAEVLRLQDAIADLKATIASQAGIIAAQKATILARDAQVEGLEATVARLGDTLAAWHAYADGVTSHAGAILGLDRP
jgi:hypothetical protein